MKKIISLLIIYQILSFAQTTNYVDYIPLIKGSEFQFSTRDKSWYGPLVIIERDTVYSNGKRYTNLPFQVFLYSDARKDSVGNLWVRNDMFFPSEDSAEVLLFKASAIVGEKWLVFKNPDLSLYDLYTECLFDTVFNIMGKERRVKEMVQYDSTGHTIYYSVAEGIGLIAEFDNASDLTLFLSYAKINNETFGFIVDYDNPNFFPINKGNEHQFVQAGTTNYKYGKVEKDTLAGSNYYLYPTEILPFGYVSDTMGLVLSISKPFVNNDTMDVYKLVSTWKETNERWAIAGQKNIYFVGNEEFYGVTTLNEEAYVFGTPRRIKHISLYNENSKLLDFVLAEGIGIIYFKYPEQTAWHLNYAKIDSVKYGTLVGIKEENGIPTNYSLNQNYPNPFNPRTTIDFTMANAGNVKIEVYNTLGEQVRTLLNEYRLAGTHSVTFEANDLPSGVYVYQLNVNGKTFSKKMVLMK